MDAVTYPEKEVSKFVNNYMTPLRLDVNNLAMHVRYRTIWTPTLAVLDLNGHEVQQKIGFFSPDEFIATMHLGLAKVHLDAGEHDTAEVHFKRLLENYTTSSFIPEAVYFRGVNLYKAQNDPNKLKEAYENILENYPDSPWVARAHPYRLI